MKFSSSKFGVGHKMEEEKQKEKNILKELRSEYRSVRLKFNLTLRDAASLLGVDGSQLSLLEHGPQPKLRQDTSALINVQCHRCGCTFEAHPLLCNNQPIVFASWVCEKCSFTDWVVGRQEG